ncbi:MAG: hypothetical protein AB7Q92_27550 [Acidimicrobiia bacterium]
MAEAGDGDTTDVCAELVSPAARAVGVGLVRAFAGRPRSGRLAMALRISMPSNWVRQGALLAAVWSSAMVAAVVPLGVAAAQDAGADVYASYLSELAGGPFTTTASLFFEVGNAGPSAAGSVVLTFSVPAGVTVLSADAHPPWSPTNPMPSSRPCAQPDPATLVCTFDGTFAAEARTGVSVVLVNTGLAAGSTVQVAGHLSSGIVDPVPTNNDVLAVITFTGEAVGLDTADLAISNDAVQDQTNPSIRTLLLSVRNGGPATAVGVTLTASVPEGAVLIAVEPPPAPPWIGQQPTVCTIAADRRQATCAVPRELRRGDGEYVRLVVVNAGLAAGTSVEVSVTAGAATVDGYAANDSVVVPVTFAGGPVALDAADVALVVVGGPAGTDPSLVRLDVGVRNNGPATATGITITFDVPDGVVVGSAQTAPAGVSVFGSCPLDSATSRLVCTSPDLPFDAFRQVPIVAINVGLPAGSTVEMLARVSRAEADPIAGNDSLSIPITFSGAPVPSRPGEATTELAVVANEPRSEQPGQVTFVWNIAVRGPASAQGLTAVVQLGAGLRATWAGLVPSGGACPVEPAVSTITCKLDRSWPVGEPLGLIVTASLVSPDAGGSLAAEAFVASDLTDPLPGNNRSLAKFAASGSTTDATATGAGQTAQTLPFTGGDSAKHWVLGAALLVAGLHLIIFTVGAHSTLRSRSALRHGGTSPSQ